MWRLWLEGKLSMSEFDQIPLEMIDAANRALDAWQDAEARAITKAQKGRR